MTDQQEVRIFVASSRHARAHAQTLTTALQNYAGEKYKLMPEPWWSGDSTLTAILDDLIQQTQRNDFAIIFLTSALTDGVPKGAEDLEKRKIRYNAIYEAGLFSGALGPSKDRCFLIASGTKEELPTDLLGLKSYFFDEAASNVKDRLKEIANRIGSIIENYAEDSVRPLRGLKQPLLLKSDLLRREAYKDKGGQLQQYGALVFVNTPNPVEMEDTSFANKILSNMLDYRIKYRYVFEDTDANITALSRVIANLTSTPFSGKWEEQPDKAFVMISENLSIYLVKENPGLEYCVHNADTDDAVCYLRISADAGEPKWVEWYKGPKAKSVATEIDRIRDRNEDQSVNYVFHNTHNVRVFDIKEQGEQKKIALSQLGRKIWTRIEGWLPDKIGAEHKAAVKKVCFGNAE